MVVVLDSFAKLTEFGQLEKCQLADMMDTPTIAYLEERFIVHSTVLVKDDGAPLQAVKVRGSAATREICFAPSDLASQASLKMVRSEMYMYVSTANEISHLFMNVIGA